MSKSKSAAMEFVESVLARPSVSPRSESNVPWRPIAQFQLDDKGRPYFETIDGAQNYWIILSLESPQLDQIGWVEYRLHKSNRIRFSDEPEKQFSDFIDVSGDFEVRVKVSVQNRLFEERIRLSAMLETGHAKDMSPEIREAIETIKAH